MRFALSRTPVPGEPARELRTLRGVLLALVGLLVVVSVLGVTGRLSASAPVASPAGPAAPASPSTSAPAAPTAPGSPGPTIAGFAAPTAPGSSAAFTGLGDPQSVYSFAIPNNLTLSWARYTGTDTGSVRLASQFRDVWAAIAEAWTSGDTRDVRLGAWCVGSCAQLADGLIGPWAAASESPVGALVFTRETVTLSPSGTSGAVAVCMSDTGLSARTEGLATVAPPVADTYTLFEFGLTYEAMEGHWVAVSAMSEPGDTACEGAAAWQ